MSQFRRANTRCSCTSDQVPPRAVGTWARLSSAQAACLSARTTVWWAWSRTVVVAAFVCSGALAQQTDKQEAQTAPKETKTMPGAEEKAARSGDSAKDPSSASDA